MPAVAACPKPEVLEQFLLGKIAEPDADRLEAHLSACPRCQQTLQSFRADDSLVQALRDADTPHDPPHKELMDAMLPLLKRLRPPEPAQTKPYQVGADASETATLPPGQQARMVAAEAEIRELGPYQVLEVLG